MTTLADIKIKLERSGFTGLFAPGDCACKLDELAPCGSCDPDDDGWINDCYPGYVHHDPSGETQDWVVTRSKEPPTSDEFKNFFDQ